MYKTKLKQAVFLLLALLLCLSACRPAAPAEELPKEEDGKNGSVPSGEGSSAASSDDGFENEPSPEKEEQIHPTFLYSEETPTEIDLSLYVAGSPAEIYDYTKPLYSDIDLSKVKLETLPVFYIPSKEESELTEEEKGVGQNYADQFFSLLNGITFSENTSLNWGEVAAYSAQNTRLSVLTNGFKITGVPVEGNISCEDRAALLNLIEENAYFNAACSLLDITDPVLFVSSHFLRGEEHHTRIFVSQRAADTVSQAINDRFYSFTIFLEGQTASFSIGTYEKTTLFQIPVLSYENAENNLLNKNFRASHKGTEWENTSADLRPESILSSRIVYQNSLFHDLEEYYFPVFEFVVRSCDSTPENPQTEVLYVPACNVSAESVAN